MITRNAPSERAAIACARPARYSTRGSSRPQVARGQRLPIASVRTSSDRALVAVDVEPARRLDRHRQHLEDHPPLDPARHVRVGVAGAPEEVPPEQQRIGVEVRDAERGMERPRGLGRRHVRVRAQHRG